MPIMFFNCFDPALVVLFFWSAIFIKKLARFFIGQKYHIGLSGGYGETVITLVCGFSILGSSPNNCP